MTEVLDFNESHAIELNNIFGSGKFIFDNGISRQGALELINKWNYSSQRKYWIFN